MVERLEPQGLIDISPVIRTSLGVWPGDVPFRRSVSHSFPEGDHLTLSAMECSLHLGAHADAPIHYTAGGDGIGERSLEPYFGPAQLMKVDVRRNERVRPQHLPGPILAPRLLIGTGTFPDPDQWNADFAGLSAELIDFVAAEGVRLIGIDTPSVDPQEDKELESHQAIARHDLSILEGLVLNEVAEGVYSLCALPLRIEGADASPVRAVLLPLS